MEQKKLLLLVCVAAAIYYFMVYKKGVSRGQVASVLKDAAAVAAEVVSPDVGKVRVATQEDLLPRSIGMVPVGLVQSDPKSLLGIPDKSS